MTNEAMDLIHSSLIKGECVNSKEIDGNWIICFDYRGPMIDIEEFKNHPCNVGHRSLFRIRVVCQSQFECIEFLQRWKEKVSKIKNHEGSTFTIGNIKIYELATELPNVNIEAKRK